MMRLNNRNYGKFISFVALMVFAVMLLIGNCQVMAAESTSAKDYVIDDAGILDDNEEVKLEKMCQKASDNCKTDIVIVTMRQGIDYGVMDNYIRNMLETDYGYNGSGSGCDAICYAIDMTSRADRIITSGIAKSDISQGRLDSIRETSESQLSDADYYDAFKKFVNNVERELNNSILYKLTWMLPVKIIIAAVVAVIAVLCMMYNAKSRMTVGTTTYTKDHQYDIKVRHDDFINTTVITRHIEKNHGSSGGGGGGGNSASSGGHF